MNSPPANRSAHNTPPSPGSGQNFVKENTTKSNAIEIPSVTLPKGGGTLKGIDEKFQINTSNGTASYAVALPSSTGRDGFTPALSLSYNSGICNSPFGLGWDIGFPVIKEKQIKNLRGTGMKPMKIFSCFPVLKILFFTYMKQIKIGKAKKKIGTAIWLRDTARARDGKLRKPCFKLFLLVLLQRFYPC